MAQDKKIGLKWERIKKSVDGYQIQYSSLKTFGKADKVKIEGNRTTSTTVRKNVKNGKTLYFRIRTYKKIDGKKYFSAWSKTKSARAKK